MADTILSTNFTIYYGDDNRRKQIRWTGTTAKSDVNYFIDVYDATEDLFTVPTQSNDGLIFSAETPGEYTIGKISAGEIDPWFIDMKTMEHVIGDFGNFTGCALKTSGWERDLPGDGTGNTGIVVVAVDGSTSTIVAGDIGQDISHANGDDGTLLDVIIDPDNTTDYLFIRPDTNTLADDFDDSTGILTEAGTSHTATQSAAAVTGEMIWGNVYSQGALKSDTHIYMYQDGAIVSRTEATTDDWWVDGQVDRAVPITDYTTANFPLIDSGYITVKANQYGSKYTHAIIRMNSTSGGNVSAGLSSGDSSTNITGYASITTTAVGTDDFSVGDEIEGSDATPARAIITQIDGSSPTYTFHYYLIGDPLVDFTSAAETITNNDATGSATKNTSAPADQGPALTTWFDGNLQPTYAFANNQVDIADTGTAQEWGITIDLQSCSLAQMHEYSKYAHMRSSTLDQDGLDGMEWIGLDYAINYSTITGSVPEGSVVTGETSGATGTVVSNPGGTSNTALLRNSRGTFVDAEDIYLNDPTDQFNASGLTVEVIVPVAESSFGTITALTNGTFFGSRGVVLSNYKGTEENSFSLIDATGTARARPTSISVVISNLLQYDYGWCWRLTGTGGSIDKTEYSATGGEVDGDATLTVDGAIAADVPNKDNGGTLALVDVSDNNQEYILRFDSFVASTGVVTLSNTLVTAEALTDASTIIDTGVFTAAAVSVGDLVYNHDLSAVSYISERTSDDEIQIVPPITGQDAGDVIEINCVPIALVDTADAVFFAIVFEFKESDGTASASMQWVSDFYAQVVVRNTGDAAVKIKGFTQEIPVTTASSGGAATATRIPNTVYGT